MPDNTGQGRPHAGPARIAGQGARATGRTTKHVPPAGVEALVARRTVLQGLLAGGAAAVLAACGSDATTASPPATAAPSTTAGSPPTPAPTSPPPSVAPTTAPPATYPAMDPNVDWWLQGGYAPVAEERELFDLEVVGSLPPELTGLYVRNGSNPIDPSGHWFFGAGMVHGVSIAGGEALWYRNRYVSTPKLRGEDGGAAPGADVGHSNVSVFEHGGRLLSSGEVGWPYELTATDLSTVGPDNFAGGIGPNFTAHPKRDPDTGLLHAFGYGFLGDDLLTYFVISADGRDVVHSSRVAVGASTMIHDFAITDRDVVFWEGPVLFDLDAAIAGAAIPYNWSPDYGSRVGVMPLGGDGADIRWVEVDNGYAFHGTNARREGDVIHLDLSRVREAFSESDGGPPTLTRWSIDTSGAELTISAEVLSDLPLDFPSIDRRFTGRPHSTAFYAQAEGSLEAGVRFPGLVAYNVATGGIDRWESGPALQPGEPYFVAAGADAGEAEGWLLTYAYEASTDTSRLVVLDATNVSAGPVAQVLLPHRVPFGFHGTFVATQA